MPDYRPQSLFQVKPSYQEQRFYVCDANDKAFAWVTQDSPKSALILGPLSSGKTHLAHIWARRHTALFYLIGMDPLQCQSPYVVCDDADQHDEQSLMHLYNMVKAQHGAILLTMSNIPQYSLKDWVSRLNAIMRLRLLSPAQEHVRSLIAKVFEDYGVHCPPVTLQYILDRVPYDYNLVIQLVQHMSQYIPERQTISTVDAKRSLQELNML